MTYCVGLLLSEGMVLLSDTRTNAGLDNISTCRKMFFFEDPGERVICVLTAGSLSVTQTTLARLRDAVGSPDASEQTSIMRAPTLLKVAHIIGDTLAQVRREMDEKLAALEQGATASMIVAGQRRGGAMRLFLIYPEGNFIEATEDTPFLQIGEHKYGKPILDRVMKRSTSLTDGPMDRWTEGRAAVDGFDAAVQSVGRNAAGPVRHRKGHLPGDVQAAHRIGG